MCQRRGSTLEQQEAEAEASCNGGSAALHTRFHMPRWLRGSFQTLNVFPPQGAGPGARLSVRSPIRSPMVELLAGGVNVPHVFLFSRNLQAETCALGWWVTPASGLLAPCVPRAGPDWQPCKRAYPSQHSTQLKASRQAAHRKKWSTSVVSVGHSPSA